MPRSPYDISVAGNCHYSAPDGSSPMDSLVTSSRSLEQISGVARRKPTGFIPPTPYSFLYRSVVNAFGRCENKHLTVPSFGQLYVGVVGGGTGVAGRFNSASHFDTALLENDQDNSLPNRALIKARNKLKSTDINLGVAFAERSATARLVGDTAVNLAKSFRHLRRGEIRRAMDVLGISSKKREPRGANAPQKWLELQYGWKPLLSDIHGACDALSKRPSDHWLVTSKGSAKSNRTVQVKFLSFDAGSMTARVEHSCFVRIDALPENVAIITLASSGITNPLLIGWELVPFSFVVDWFLPVGGWLESLDAMLGYRTVGYSSSYLSRMWWDGKGDTLPPASGFQIKNSYQETKRVVRLVRSVSSGVPFPHFPRFKDPRSFDHMANGLSLLATAFGRK